MNVWLQTSESTLISSRCPNLFASAAACKTCTHAHDISLWCSHQLTCSPGCGAWCSGSRLVFTCVSCPSVYLRPAALSWAQIWGKCQRESNNQRVNHGQFMFKMEDKNRNGESPSDAVYYPQISCSTDRKYYPFKKCSCLFITSVSLRVNSSSQEVLALIFWKRSWSVID